jgi:uncharacterized membrane protein
MSLISATLDVAIPVRRAYEQWVQFEDYPRFLHDVDEVVRIDEEHLHWRGRVAGVRREWSATVTELRVDELVAWTSDGAVRFDGVVTFEPQAARCTRVTLWLDVGGQAGAVLTTTEGLGVVSNRALAVLERFRELVEPAPADGRVDGDLVGRIA